MAQKKISYKNAISELEKILSEIESGEMDLDILSEKIKHASELIRYCKIKLRNTGEEVQKVLGEIKNN